MDFRFLIYTPKKHLKKNIFWGGWWSALVLPKLEGWGERLKPVPGAPWPWAKQVGTRAETAKFYSGDIATAVCKDEFHMKGILFIDS